MKLKTAKELFTEIKSLGGDSNHNDMELARTCVIFTEQQKMAKYQIDNTYKNMGLELTEKGKK